MTEIGGVEEFAENLESREINILFGGHQRGKSTVALAHVLWFGLFNPNKSIVVMGHKLTFAMEIIKRMKDIRDNVDDLVLPEIISFTKSEIKLDNGTIIRACGPNNIRGISIQYLLLDEVGMRPEIYETSGYEIR